jgi:hypothetical protein
MTQYITFPPFLGRVKKFVPKPQKKRKPKAGEAELVTEGSPLKKTLSRMRKE